MDLRVFRDFAFSAEVRGHAWNHKSRVKTLAPERK